MGNLIYGTTNKKKIEELQALFELYKINMKILSLKDIDFTDEIDENGSTLEENSLIKAQAVKEFCDRKGIKANILTDDAGLCVDYLNGAPGVRTGRYAGENASQEDNIRKLLDDMQDASGEQRKGRHECVLTYLPISGKKIVVKGVTNGRISETIGTLGGQTFWPVIIPDGSDIPLSEFSKSELANSDFSYRKKAFMQLMDKLKERETEKEL